MPTHYRGTARETRALDAYIKLMRAADTLGHRVGQRLAAHDLTMGQLGVLEALLHLGPMSQRELGHKLLRSHSNMCTVLDNLERAGWIQRERSPDDRRVMIVSLTREGEKLIRRVFPAHAADIADAMDGLTADELEQLAALCKKLGTTAR